MNSNTTRNIALFLKVLVIVPVTMFYLFGCSTESLSYSRNVGEKTDAFLLLSIAMEDLLIANPFKLILTSDLLTWIDTIYMIPWFANPALLISMVFLFKDRYRMSITFAMLSFLFAVLFLLDPHYFNVISGRFVPATALPGYYLWLLTILLYCFCLAILTRYLEIYVRSKPTSKRK